MYFTCLNLKKILKVLCCAVAFVFLCLIFRGTGAYAVFYGSATRKLPIYGVETQEKKLSISFDCAWGTDYTDSLLQTMEKEGVRCTFFCVKFWSEKYPDYLKKISEKGHEIGTHSSTHPYMSKLDRSAIIKELTESSEAIESVIGKKVELFRPPYGDYDDLLIDTATELGLYTIQWSVDSLDWKDLSAREIEKRVLSRVKNGSIVLFHNQGLHTHEALPNIISALKAEGYSIVPIGELIYRENFTVAHDGTQIKK